MKFRSFRYYLTESVTNLFRNGIMTLVSILTVFCCIFMLVLTFCLAINVDYMLQQLGSTLGFTVIIRQGATTDEINQLYFEIANADHVAAVRYISAQEAMDSFKETLGDDRGILDGLEKDNPLPHTFEIRVTDPRYMELVVKNIQNTGGETIEEINQQTQTVNTLISFNRGVRVISLIIVGLFIGISVVIIVNTIKLTVNNRKAEISIMKYVGATDWFIRWPFIIEGILIGIIGAIIADAIFAYAYNSLIISGSNALSILGSFTILKSASEVMPLTSFIAIFMGIAIGAIGSTVSVRKYLKV